MAYIKIPDNAVDDYLKLLQQVQYRHRFLERFMGKRIPVDQNRKIMTLIKKLKAVGGKIDKMLNLRLYSVYLGIFRKVIFKRVLMIIVDFKRFLLIILLFLLALISKNPDLLL
jgi:hypothetical protein